MPNNFIIPDEMVRRIQAMSPEDRGAFLEAVQAYNFRPVPPAPEPPLPPDVIAYERARQKHEAAKAAYQANPTPETKAASQDAWRELGEARAIHLEEHWHREGRGYNHDREY